MKNHNIVLLLVIISTLINSQPGCRQVGNRLAFPGDSKGFTYVSCSCPCNEYEQLTKQQCAVCKHYPESNQNSIKILKNIDIHEAHKQYLKHIQK